MLLWLLHHLAPFQEQMSQHAAGDSRVYLTARIALAAVTSFLAAILLGPLAIRWLQARARERIDSASEKLNKLHAGKSNTPTMGGHLLLEGGQMVEEPDVSRTIGRTDLRIRNRSADRVGHGSPTRR